MLLVLFMSYPTGIAGGHLHVLISGGGGFLGAWIVRRLAPSGADIRILDTNDDRSRIAWIAGDSAAAGLEWMVGDVSDFVSVEGALRGCDAVIHLAGLLTPACRENPIRGALVNVIGTLNVFEAAKASGISRVVYTSSGGVFGPDSGDPPFPFTHYGAFKLANEGNARTYWVEHRIASIGFRPFVVYGPGRDSGLTSGITEACRAAARGEEYVIPLSGAMGLVYVDDVAAAYEAAIMTQFEGAHTLNLTGTVATVKEVISSIRRVVPDARITCDGPAMPISPNAPNEFVNDLLSIGRERTLDEGIAETIEFYRDA